MVFIFKIFFDGVLGMFLGEQFDIGFIGNILEFLLFEEFIFVFFFFELIVFCDIDDGVGVEIKERIDYI